MEYKQLGRTGLNVSVAGLGCGGSSRLGRAAGKSEDQSVALVQRAIDLGVNFFDTAEAYGTEAIVGQAIRSVPRDSVVISTKSRIRAGDDLASGQKIVANLEASLHRLGTDYVDVFHLHGIPPRHYDHVVQEIVPALMSEKEKGKLRHLGITETGPNDPKHEMLSRALHEPFWEVVMLAFHMLNQNARERVFPLSQAKGVGTLLMFVVRRIFSDPDYLRETVEQLAAAGQVPAELVEKGDPLEFLIYDGGARSVIDAAYRYARHEPGADVILFGTGDETHLESNIDAILSPPLPAPDREELQRLFGALEGVGLDLPRHMQK